jgi:hypothetical protein
MSRSMSVRSAASHGCSEVERRVSSSGEVTYRARYAMPDGTR